MATWLLITVNNSYNDVNSVFTTPLHSMIKISSGKMSSVMTKVKAELTNNFTSLCAIIVCNSHFIDLQSSILKHPSSGGTDEGIV